MSFRSTIRSIIGKIKETFPPKTGMQIKQVLQDAGYVEGVKSPFNFHCVIAVFIMSKE